jgi:hypothetical protein
MDDEEQTGISTAVRWRPRTPEIGQRVRIRLSGECPLLRSEPGQKETSTAWHSHSEDGMIGIVITPTPNVWMPRMGLDGHAHLLSFRPDSVNFDGCAWYSALYFAAPELEPLEDDADDAL